MIFSTIASFQCFLLLERADASMEAGKLLDWNYIVQQSSSWVNVTENMEWPNSIQIMKKKIKVCLLNAQETFQACQDFQLRTMFMVFCYL